MKISIGGRLYTISFRHKTQLGKRAALHRRSPVKAVTICAITVQKDSGALELVAIDCTLCSLQDNFERRKGRILALEKTLKYWELYT